MVVAHLAEWSLSNQEDEGLNPVYVHINWEIIKWESTKIKKERARINLFKFQIWVMSIKYLMEVAENNLVSC